MHVHGCRLESELQGNMPGIDLLRSRNFNASGITISDPCSISYSSGSSSGSSITITHHSSWRHKDLASFRLTRACQSHRFDHQTKESSRSASGYRSPIPRLSLSVVFRSFQGSQMGLQILSQKPHSVIWTPLGPEPRFLYFPFMKVLVDQKKKRNKWRCRHHIQPLTITP